MMRCNSALILVVVTIFFLASQATAITIPTLPVGNAGNAPDSTGLGAVAYNYRIGTTEVTVAQYAAFLNAVAKTDTYALYDTRMSTDLNVAGISRSGASGSYVYSVIGSSNQPVTYVSWGSSARFSNWLQNGQPSGLQNASTTESGAYNLNGATSTSLLNQVTRAPGAQWFIPTENEWYKAAYHKNDGVTGNYWAFPTSSNVAPFGVLPPGSAAPTPSNTANYYANGYVATGSTALSSTQNYLTDVGAYLSATSPYGTFDQGGNVNEWTQDIFTPVTRSTRGGGWSDPAAALQSNAEAGFVNPAFGDPRLGFRVATVPEPATAVLAIVAFGLLCGWRKRRRFCDLATGQS